MSQVLVKNIYVEDLFKWFYEHVLDSCGDGAATICCSNYQEVSEDFVTWWKDVHLPILISKGVKYDKNNFGLHDKFIRDGLIGYTDGNENFLFCNSIIDAFDKDYVFIVMEDCPPSKRNNQKYNTIKAIKQ